MAMLARQGGAKWTQTMAFIVGAGASSLILTLKLGFKIVVLRIIIGCFLGGLLFGRLGDRYALKLYKHKVII